MHMSAKFRRFDFGREGNIRKYGQETPPDYNTDNITNPYLAFISAKADTIINFEDVQRLKKTLKVKLFDDHVVDNPRWNHIDYNMGNNCGYYVNWKILDILKRCEREQMLKSH